MTVKYIIPVTVLAIIFISCQPSKTDRIKEYKRQCILMTSKQIDRDFARIGFLSPIDSYKVLFESNCQCKAEILIEHFSEKELKEMDQLPENEEQKILNPLINPCIVELEKNARAFLDREKIRIEIYMDALNEKSKTQANKKQSP